MSGIAGSLILDTCNTVMSSFKNLVRFSSNGQVHYGDLVEAKDGKYVVRRLDGALFEDDLIQTEDYHTVDTVRSFSVNIYLVHIVLTVIFLSSWHQSRKHL